MLFQQRYFCLHGKLDVLQVCVFATIRCDSRKHPGTALLIHHLARAIDRIDDHTPDSVAFGRTSRQNQPAILNPFSNENQRCSACQFLFEQFDQQVFTNAIDRVDCVAFGFIVRYFGELFQLGLLSLCDDCIANSFMNPANWTKQATDVAHDCSCL